MDDNLLSLLINIGKSLEKCEHMHMRANPYTYLMCVCVFVFIIKSA